MRLHASNAGVAVPQTNDKGQNQILSSPACFAQYQKFEARSLRVHVRQLLLVHLFVLRNDIFTGVVATCMT